MVRDCEDSPKIRQILLHWGYELTNYKKIKNFIKSQNNKKITDCTRKDCTKIHI